jgi:5-methylcytosine-specific restriction endonuclease McrA
VPHPRFPNAPGRYIPLVVREQIMERSEGICFYCGEVADSIDHIIPWSQGGTHHPMNLVASCMLCNVIAGERLFRDITDKMAYIAQRRHQLTTRYRNLS